MAYDDVDPRLLQLLQQVSENDPEFDVDFTSGYRPGDPRLHGRHMATDVRLTDRATKKALANYQDASTFAQYQRFANRVYQAASPELRKSLRWGGYFSGGKGKYGAMDPMHFDLGGELGMQMGGGSWEGGLNEDQAKLWGIAAGGGANAGAAVQAMEPSVRDRFLATIAGPESAGRYNVMYGGNTFDDYSRHPGVYTDITSGPNKGQKSSAAGKYQFLESTWNDQAKKLGLKDFSPESQDAAAWNLAKETYAAATGNADLEEALASNDPARVNAAADILKKTWTSMPGGVEQQGYGGKTFYDAYTNAKVAPKQATGGATAAPTGQPGKSTEKKKSLWETFGEGISDFAKGAKPMTYNIDPGPQAALVASKSMPIADQSAVDAQRQRLAQMMARLNQPSGPPKLWG